MGAEPKPSRSDPDVLGSGHMHPVSEKNLFSGRAEGRSLPFRLWAALTRVSAAFALYSASRFAMVACGTCINML